jgi:hypothetical protein
MGHDSAAMHSHPLTTEWLKNLGMLGKPLAIRFALTHCL